MKTYFALLSCILFSLALQAQNSMVGDGFGGRLWYKPYNYTVGSYSAYTICGEDKQLYAWGANNFGQLGNGSFISVEKPTQVSNMSHVKYYSTGYVMGAIKDDGTGWVWGLGLSNLNCTLPVKVLDDVLFVDAGVYNSAFVKNDGTVWSVGENSTGEFGNGQNYNSFTWIPHKMLNINNAVRTAQGYYSTTVLLKNGSMWVAGMYNGNKYTTPVKIDINAFIVDIKATANGNLALDSAGHLWHWNHMTIPQPVSGIDHVVAISGCNDGSHFFILTENHECYAYKGNNMGQCGLPSNVDISKPVKVADDVNDIMAGETFSYIIKSDGQLYATGYSNGGSIWLNQTNIKRTEFTPIDPTLPAINLCGTSNTGEYGTILPPVPIVDTPIVFFPNAFSPNADTRNDVFKPICADPAKVEVFDLKIFNRYGNLLFHSTSLDKAWDGGQNDLSTYFYYCRYKPYGKRFQEVKGDVILVK
ncbi:MAG: gliding motility-associated C-terminal domain-containing protein [Chitinophagaceae bacterium]|nr:gliding motility-associated C-terminal domain-containing protein [Chitinophagaceae bacterium]